MLNVYDTDTFLVFLGSPIYKGLLSFCLYIFMHFWMNKVTLTHLIKQCINSWENEHTQTLMFMAIPRTFSLWKTKFSSQPQEKSHKSKLKSICPDKAKHNLAIAKSSLSNQSISTWTCEPVAEARFSPRGFKLDAQLCQRDQYTRYTHKCQIWPYIYSVLFWQREFIHTDSISEANHIQKTVIIGSSFFYLLFFAWRLASTFTPGMSSISVYV